MKSKGLLTLATALTLAVAPSAAAASPEVHLPNLRVGEADAATGAPLTINVALDRPNPYCGPGVGDRARLHDAARGTAPRRPVPTMRRSPSSGCPGRRASRSRRSR